MFRHLAFTIFPLCQPRELTWSLMRSLHGLKTAATEQRDSEKGPAPPQVSLVSASQGLPSPPPGFTGCNWTTCSSLTQCLAG